MASAPLSLQSAGDSRYPFLEDALLAEASIPPLNWCPEREINPFRPREKEGRETWVRAERIATPGPRR